MSDNLKLECQLLACLISKSRKLKVKKQISKSMAELTLKMVNEACSLFGEDFVIMNDLKFILEHGGSLS